MNLVISIEGTFKILGTFTIVTPDFKIRSLLKERIASYFVQKVHLQIKKNLRKW